jgi:hypothetical protein
MLALLLLFSLQFLIDLRHISTQSVDNRERFFYSFAGSFIYGSNMVKHAPVLAPLISFLANVCLMIVCSNVASFLTCTYDGISLGTVATSAGTMACWDDVDYRWKAALALLLFSYYVPLATMVTPMLTEAPDSPKELTFVASFVMLLGTLKTFQFIVPVLFQGYTTAQLVTTLAVQLLFAGATIAWTVGFSSSDSKDTFFVSPCAVPQMNFWYIVPFVGGACVALSQLLSLSNNLVLVALAPVALVCIAWSIYYQRKVDMLADDEEVAPADVELNG